MKERIARVRENRRQKAKAEADREIQLLKEQKRQRIEQVQSFADAAIEQVKVACQKKIEDEKPPALKSSSKLLQAPPSTSKLPQAPPSSSILLHTPPSSSKLQQGLSRVKNIKKTLYS